MRRLALCFVGPAASISLQRWVDWFAAKGHECTVLTVEPVRPAPVGRWHQIDLSKHSMPRTCGRLVSALRLVQTIQRLRPDLVHVHYLRGVAWGIAVKCPRPCVVTPWGSDVLADQGAFREWYSKGLTRRLLSEADLVTTHSAYMEAEVRRLAPRFRAMVRIGWGIDLDCFRPELDSTALRQRWKIDPGQKVILSPRLLQPFYNHDLIIRSLPTVLRAVPNTVLILTEYFADPAYLKQLRQITTDLGISEQVRFVGELPYAEMPLWYNLSSAVVMMPSSDGLPNSLLETMACGSVPIVNRLPQYDELVRDQVNGRRVTQDSHALSVALIQVLQDETFRRWCRKENRCLMESVGDQNREMAKMEALYQELVESSGLVRVRHERVCAQ